MFLLDPVMGDHGKCYSTVTAKQCLSLKALAVRADILTPNLTEACLLTDTDYHDGWTDRELENLCEKLRVRCPESKIVITGVRQGESFLNLILEGEKKTVCETPVTGASRPGTGDLFASVLIADVLCGKSLSSSVRHATDFVALCIRGSEEAGTSIQEGVIFERHLRDLILTTP